MECSENVAHHMMRASPASEQDVAGAIPSMTPAVDSTLAGKDQERSQSLKMRATFKCTNLLAFQTASPIKIYLLIAFITFKAPQARGKDVTPWKAACSVLAQSK